MIVEEIRVDKENFGKFPAGLRVLAVDDDPICLKLLETLLRKCQYQVTITSQARVALKMLRENKGGFDLVISDVHMPDMDGFKLLELVGLELDLPVVMLSANSDTELVMNAINDGACDYLVKPVRIEELRNIWQHLLRRKKFDSKSQNASAVQMKDHLSGGEGYVSPTTGSTDHNGKFNRKRKDEDDEHEENGNDSEDPTTQKKPRVVWSIELHRKFVAAVNQLGIEKAVPKRILDMMNIEGLTRENVASHLQKYRLYLKRITHAATQQANIAAAFVVKDSPFMRMGSLDGLGDFRTLSGTGRLALSPYSTGGMLGRLNSPANVNLRSLTPSLMSPTHATNMNNSITSLGKTYPAIPSTGQNQSLFQGISTSLELDQLQQKGIINFTGMDDSRMLTASNTFTDPGAAMASCSNMLSSTTNNSLMLVGGFGNQSSNNMASFNSDSFNTGSSNLLDPAKSKGAWQNSIESSKMQPSSLVSSDPCHSQLMRETNSSNGLFSHNSVVSSGSLQDSREIPGLDLVGDAQNMNQVINQRWGDKKQNNGQSPNFNEFCSSSSQIPANSVVSHLNRSLDQNSGIFNNPKMDKFRNGGFMQQNDNSATEARVRSDHDFLLEHTKLQGGFVNQNYGSLDDLMNGMIKREHDESMPNCDFGFDDYGFGQGF